MKTKIRTVLDWLCILFSGMFDRRYYLQTYPDIRSAKTSPLIHYLRHGGFEGRNPSADFQSSAYLDRYPDVKSSGMNPLVHYIRFGKAEGRNPKASAIQSVSLKTSTLALSDSSTLIFDHSWGGGDK